MFQRDFLKFLTNSYKVEFGSDYKSKPTLRFNYSPLCACEEHGTRYEVM